MTSSPFRLGSPGSPAEPCGGLSSVADTHELDEARLVQSAGIDRNPIDQRPFCVESTEDRAALADVVEST